jgi:hypothetical protein
LFTSFTSFTWAAATLSRFPQAFRMFLDVKTCQKPICATPRAAPTFHGFQKRHHGLKGLRWDSVGTPLGLCWATSNSCDSQIDLLGKENMKKT